MSDDILIYVAGNPDLYPLEYYDEASQSYQGVIPDLLRRFGEGNGYDVRYYQPGAVDQREEQAENQQVDLISGCTSSEEFDHAGEPVVLLRAEENGEAEVYQLYLTEAAPESLQEELEAFVSELPEEELTGALLEVVSAQPKTSYGPVAIGLGAAACLLLAALLIVVRRLRRRLKRAEENSLIDRDTGLGTEEKLARDFASLVNEKNRPLYCVVYFHFEMPHIERLGGPGTCGELRRFAASVLKKRIGPGDAAAKLDNGDLAVLKLAESTREAEAWGKAALEEIGAFSYAGGTIRMADVGVGVYPLLPEDDELQKIIYPARQCAAAACREEAGCRVCGGESCRICQRERQLLWDLDRGLDRGEIQLCLQFFVDARDFHIVGGEALSRWNHPERGVLNSASFIPLLEREGRIGELDFYMLEKACAFLEELDGKLEREFFISCNFSRVTFSRNDFVKKCRAVLGQHHFERKMLVLEVTESWQVQEGDQARMLQNIIAIRALGVRVMFDDFGAGASSFHDLQEYPMDGLKLDKYLVDHMFTNQGGILLNALVQTGHALGVTILAEGVENDDQVEALQRLQCDILQGFRFSVPVPAEEARRTVLERK